MNKASLPETGLIRWFTEMNFLHCGILLFVICSIVLIGVSLMTKPLPDEQLAGLTFQTPRSAGKVDRGHLPLMISLSVLVSLVVIAIWIYFSPFA